jgi:transcriptional regulator with XRE-family HTH domain
MARTKNIALQVTLRKIRKRKGLSAKEVAERAQEHGLIKSHFIQFEKNVNHGNVHTLLSYIAVLDMTIEEFLVELGDLDIIIYALQQKYPTIIINDHRNNNPSKNSRMVK